MSDYTITTDGKKWYENGVLIKWEDPKGNMYYFENNEAPYELHREDGPAIENVDGSKVWIRFGEIVQREDSQGGTRYYLGEGKEKFEFNGDTFWYTDGKTDREDGPAIIKANGDMYWLKEDSLHREDGPAIVRIDGSKRWYINNQIMSEQEFNEITAAV